MAGEGNETRLIFLPGENGCWARQEPGCARRIFVIEKLKSARQGRIVGADTKRAAAPSPAHIRGAASNQKIRRSANGSQAGAAEYSRFLPQHSAKGTAQYYDLFGQWREADRPAPIVRQVLGSARNQQPGAAHFQACDFDGCHLARSPRPRGRKVSRGVAGRGFDSVCAFWQ